MTRGSTFDLDDAPAEQKVEVKAPAEPVVIHRAVEHLQVTEPMPVALEDYQPTQEELDTTLRVLNWYQESVRRRPTTKTSARAISLCQGVISEIPGDLDLLLESLTGKENQESDD